MANRNPYALSFNGSTYIRTTNGISNVSSVVTISFWATFDNTSWKGVQIGFAGVYNLYYNNVSGLNVFGFNTWNNDAYGISNASAKLADGNPHHIVAEFNTSNVTLNKLWIDGVKQTLSQVWGTPNNNNFSLSTNLWIGCGTSTTDQMHKGIIDEITVWNRSLSDNEINSLKYTTGNENGLVGYFKMDDGSGNQITNFLTGNKYTITGTQIWVNGIVDLGINKILILSNDNKVKSLKYINNNTPIMTSNTLPYGEVKASSYYSAGGALPYKAFDGIIDSWVSGWVSNGSKNQWISYSYPYLVDISKYAIWSVKDNLMPKEFRFEISNDGVNWTVVDQRIMTLNDWKDNDWNYFDLDKPVKAKSFRLYCVNNNGSGLYISIREMKLIGEYTHLIELPSISEQNFINYGIDPPAKFDEVLTNKNYILQDGISKNENGYLVAKLDRKPLSIKFE